MKQHVGKTLLRIFACCIAATLLSAAFAMPASAATVTYSTNVSSSKVTKSSDSGSLPTSVSKVTGGKSYYFNLQTSDSVYITSAALYVKLPTESDYTKVYTKTSSSGVHYVAYKYTINNTRGTLKYYWKTDYKTSSSSSKKTKSSSTKSVTISATTTVYNSTLSSFLSNSKWKNGVSWGSSQKPKASSYSSSGCCAYVADVAYKVYGKSSPRSGTSFNSASKVRAGDILQLKRTSTGKTHWIYVYGRSGDTLYVAEANWDETGNGSSKVYVTTSKWYISGSYLYRGSSKYKFSLTKGYHFEK